VIVLDIGRVGHRVQPLSFASVVLSVILQDVI
jgi:hypothetical protein